MNSYPENELKNKFLKPFADNNLLTFIGMNCKYNPDYVNAFYCNLELTTSGFQSRFKDRIVKFIFSDFINCFGMRSEGTNVSNSKVKDYEKISFVLDISIYVCEHMEILKFRISQIKFGMRFIHWVIVNILARKPGKSSRDDDNDLFLMWCLIYNIKTYKNDWVRFIFDGIIYCRNNPKSPIFFFFLFYDGLAA